ncbi:MAG: hypothetical protein ACYTG5_04045 [Planctomycetota bacterium]
MWVPGIYGMEHFASGCIGGLRVARSLTDLNYWISIVDPNALYPNTIAWSALVLGTTPTSLTVPVPPFCTLQANPRIMLPGAGDSAQAFWQLPADVLPAGLEYYAQVAWLHTNGSVYLTDALRTF